MTTRRILLAGLAGAMLLPAPAALAQYPDKPIRMLVGFVPGGFTDVLARIVAEKLSVQLGKPVVVENKPGAAATIAADQAAKAKPDGYTLLMGHVNSNAIAPALYPKLPYNVLRDFTPIVRVASTPLLLTVSTSVSAPDLKTFLAQAKAKEFTFASSGQGSIQHLAGEMFMQMTGVKMRHIPYKGSAQAIVDLISNQVDLNFESPPNVLAHLKSGKVRVLAITSRERSPLLPDVPTLDEAGVPGFEIGQWFGVLGPAGLPKDITERLNREINAILKMPDVVERIRSQDGKAIGGTPEEFAEFIKDDTARWAKVIKDAGIDPSTF